MDSPMVSVIVPIYNAEKYMYKCIESIQNQSLKNIEIILINDGSTDNSGTIADEYAKKDKRIKVIHQENSGPSVARNKGIEIATGKYIGFVDIDDYIEPTMYEELYNSAYYKNIQVAMCGYIEKYLYDESYMVVKSNLQSNKVYDEEGIKKNIISTFAKNENYGFYSMCNKIYLREWLVNSSIKIDINRDHGEDWWFNINVLSKISSFIYIDRQLYNYVHVNPNSLMFKYRENQFDLFLDGRQKMKDIIPIEYIDYEEFNRRFIYEFSSYIIRSMKEVKDKKKIKELVNNVLDNSEVVESCNNVSKLPLHFRITSLFIKFRMKKLSILTYKVMSKIAK